MNETTKEMYDNFIESFTRLATTRCRLELALANHPEDENIQVANTAICKLTAELSAVRSQWAQNLRSNGLSAGPSLETAVWR